MESGGNPEQSGYCDVERTLICHCVSGKAEETVKLSQDTFLNRQSIIFRRKIIHRTEIFVLYLHAPVFFKRKCRCFYIFYGGIS